VIITRLSSSRLLDIYCDAEVSVDGHSEHAPTLRLQRSCGPCAWPQTVLTAARVLRSAHMGWPRGRLTYQLWRWTVLSERPDQVARPGVRRKAMSRLFKGPGFTRDPKMQLLS
jgi:hypothetical protein